MIHRRDAENTGGESLKTRTRRTLCLCGEFFLFVFGCGKALLVIEEIERGRKER